MIRDALRWDTQVDPSEIAVSVVNGRVALSGAVESNWQKLKAEEATASVTGVLEIVNDLVVMTGDRVTDRALSEEISRAFNAAGIRDTVDVTVSGGRVRLSGTVSESTYREVEEIVRYVPGVRDIENDLIIT